MNLMLLPLAAGLGACRHGFVLAPDGACIRCPAHFDCTNASNVESTRVQSGWWRPSNTSLTAHKCIPPERCTGGGAGDAGCSPGSSLYGILCEVCPAGSRYANGSCQRCNAGASSLSAAILVVIFLVLLVLPFFVVKLQGRRPKGSPRAVDPAGAATAATPSPSLPIPPPNGDLGGGEARPREGIARRARAQSLVERLTSYARRLNHYLRGHVWRRLRTIWRGAALGNKLRMTVGHLQLVSLLPSTYLLNPLHGVEQVSHVFSTRGSVTEWEEGSCLFTSIRQPVLLLVLKTWTPLLICALWLLLGLLHGCRYNTDPAGRPRPLNFAKIKRGFIRAEERRLRNAPARGHRLRDGHLLASVVTRVRQDESARDAIRDAAGGRSDGPAAAGHPVATDSSAVESAEVPPAHRQLTKQLTVALGTWWEETVRKRGLPLYFLPYNASSTAMLSPILGLLHLLAPFLAQDAFDLLFAVEQRADGVSYVEAAPSVEWDSAEHAKLRRHATAEAVIYGGLVPLFYLAVLSANDKHIRDGSNTNNARAVQLLTSGYRRERAAEKADDELRAARTSGWLYRFLAGPRAWLLRVVGRLQLWWEVAETLKTLFVTSYLCGFARGTSLQALVGLLYLLAHFAVFIVAKPYRSASNSWYQSLCLLVQAWALLLCLLLHVQAARVLVDDETVEDPVLRGIASESGHTWLSGALDASLALAALFFVLSLVYGGLFEEQPIRALRWISTDAELTRGDLPRIERGELWHLFLSHAWSDGQYQTHALYDSLRTMIPGLKDPSMTGP